MKGKTGERIQMSRGTHAIRLSVMELGRFMDEASDQCRRMPRGARYRH
jgi:hypothetical protein